MTIQQAIERAIEGGWKHGEAALRSMDKLRQQGDGAVAPAIEAAVMLTPAFWKALGKVEGWKSVNCEHVGCQRDSVKYCPAGPEWIDNWHRLIDTLASGGSIEGFFETL